MIPIALFIVTLHELGHGIAARYYQMPVDHITLTCIGGVAQIKLNDRPKEVLVVSIAGPLVNIIIGLLALLTIGLPNMQHMEGFLKSPLANLNGIYGVVFFINALILGFNLLPIYPMDGGRILQGLGEICFGKKSGAYLALSACIICGIPVAAYFFTNQAFFPATIITLMAGLGAIEKLSGIKNYKK